MISCNPFSFDGIVHLLKVRPDDLLHGIHHLQSLPEVAAAQVSRGGGCIDPEGSCREVDTPFSQVRIDRAPPLFGKMTHQGIMQVVNQVCHQIKFSVSGTKAGNFPRMQATLFRLPDRRPGEFKSLAAQLINGRPQRPGDPANTYSNPQLQRAHPPSQIKNEPGDLGEIIGDGLKLIPGSDRVRQANPLFPEMGRGDETKLGAEDRTQVPGSTRGNHVGDDHTPELFRHMHTPMQLYIIAYLRATRSFRLAYRADGCAPPNQFEIYGPGSFLFPEAQIVGERALMAQQPALAFDATAIACE